MNAETPILTKDQQTIAALTAQNAALTEQNETQADTIKALWVEMATIKKRDAHAQAYIPKLKARLTELEAQQTPEARAELVFNN